MRRTTSHEDIGARMGAWFQRYRDLPGMGRLAMLGVGFVTREVAQTGVAEGRLVEITDQDLVESLKFVWEHDRHRDINPSDTHTVCVVMSLDWR